ncbi:neuralized-like protein 4 isoform X1 [Glandiceps talaboti]
MQVFSRASFAGTDTTCEYHQRCKRFVKKELKLPDAVFSDDNRFDTCYCSHCHASRGDRTYYYRGNPQKKMTLPIGWARFGLDVIRHKIDGLKVDKEWYVGYHGTQPKAVRPILDAGMLLCPQDVTLGGDKLTRRVEHTKEHNHMMNFDYYQVFMSPSIKYVEKK